MWSKSQREAANLLSKKYSDETISEWAAMRNKFDEDPEGPNPYKHPETRTFPILLLASNILIPNSTILGVTMKQLRREIEKEEARQIEHGQNPPYKVGPAGFFHMAIGIENQQ